MLGQIRKEAVRKLGDGIMIYAIDPGPTKGAIVFWHDGVIFRASPEVPNHDILGILRSLEPESDQEGPRVYIEMIDCMGMAVGREVFDTVRFVGRVEEICTQRGTFGGLVYRHQVKMHHCGNMRAKDANIRQSLIDKYGTPGTKKNPGRTYGVSSHAWSAFAIATYVSETSDFAKTPKG